MKRLYIVAMAIMMALSTGFAQEKTAVNSGKKEQKELREDKNDRVNQQQERRKEREELRKMAEKERKHHVDRTVAKEAKRLEKEGWQVRPGSPSIEAQLEQNYTLRNQYDEDLYPKYIMGEASSKGGNYDAAKTAARSLAINNLAGQIQTEVTALIENTVVNKQITEDEAYSLTETTMKSMSLISQSIGRTIPVMELHRSTGKNVVEVLVVIAYSGDEAKKVARKAILQQLEEKGEKLQEQMDKVLGL